MIGIKDKEVRRQLLEVPYHPILQDVLDWIDDGWPGLMIFTCGYRKGDPKCHGTIPCRAVDLRSRAFDNPETVKCMINNYWEYDTDPALDRQLLNVCKYHNVGNGWHFHIQVHDNTRRRIL